ncbi:class I tRNA ligase family protein [Alkalilimnicola ehrlichii]
MFAAPPEQSLEWSDSGVEGSYRFLKRLWNLVQGHVEQGVAAQVAPADLNDVQRDLRRKVHETIQKASDDIGRRYTFNTAIAAVMELTNALAKGADDTSAGGRSVLQEGLEAAVLILAPIAPHIAHTLWNALGHDEPVVDAAWPDHDPQALTRDSIELAVQVNGKLRGQIQVPADADKAACEAAALSEPNVKRFIEGKSLARVIVVPGRLVNLVVK